MIKFLYCSAIASVLIQRSSRLFHGFYLDFGIIER